MTSPVIRSGKFFAGSDLVCGKNVVINVAEEMKVGERCVLPDNAYFCGRRIEIGDDFYGYSWEHPDPESVGVPGGSWLEVGRGRIDEEYAILRVGDRCTFHNNRIDLADLVTISNDVGLSPDVVVYTHYYWQNFLEGNPWRVGPVLIGNRVLIGFRSVVLPGALVQDDVVIGAQSVVSHAENPGVYAGSPARFLKSITSLSKENKINLFELMVERYKRSLKYRNLSRYIVTGSYPEILVNECRFNCQTVTMKGTEDEYTDDFRDFAFRHGIRFYTKRPFRKLASNRVE